jgi:mono/diheme cytochrome c family protein
MKTMPKGLVYLGLVLLIFAMIPPALIMRTRAVPNENRRIHYILDMDVQGKFMGQAPAPHLFADGRAMRPPVDGAVARGLLLDDDHYVRGVAGDAQTGAMNWADAFPAQVTVDMTLLNRGQDRYNIFCAPCHGVSGFGDGMINQRALELQRGNINGTTWVDTRSLHLQEVREMPVGQIYHVITYGVRTMAPYESQIPIHDRWAIAAYVKALQRSQHANPQDAAAEQR